MSVLIRDTGFVPEDWAQGFTTNRHEINGENGAGLILYSDTDTSALGGALRGIGMIKVVFDSFADGRVFTLARQLRLMGYSGRLRLSGPLLADQYAMARRVGYDEVEIDRALAARQPEPRWIFRADWTAHDYQTRLRAGA
jgi:uncharacterized protein (DUF934 family)